MGAVVIADACLTCAVAIVIGCVGIVMSVVTMVLARRAHQQRMAMIDEMARQRADRDG